MVALLTPHQVMFGMRWLTKADQDWSGRWLIYDSMLGRGMALDQVARHLGKEAKTDLWLID